MPLNIELRLSKLLLDLIIVRYRGFKKPDLKTWSLHIDKMIRLDKRKVGDIEAVIKWCQSDSFWNNNILSTKKLRDKFDQLYLKMPKQKIYVPEQPKKPEPPRISTPEIRRLNSIIMNLAKIFVTPSTEKERQDAKLEIKRLGAQINELVENEKGKVGK